MKKLEVSQEMYAEWDIVKKKLDQYNKENKEWTKRVQKKMKENPDIIDLDILFPPRPVSYKDVNKLFTILRMLPKALSGRNRKREEELVLVPRGIMTYVVQCACMGVPIEKKHENGDHQEGDAV